MTTQIELVTGERLDSHERRNDGVVTDAGVIPWADIAGFWCYHPKTKQMLFVPAR